MYGASYVDNCTVQHIRVTQKEQLRQLQGSKYVHSYIMDTYKKIKNDIEDTKRKVLFIGTPCQIAGLKNYLQKVYENLILVDIICHGVPSQKYLKEEVQRITNGLDIDRVNFRDGNNYGFFIIKDNKIIYSATKEKSPYCDAFFSAISLRDNCYECKYANSSRISDITIGDFWGLSEESRFYADRENGVSTVIISTTKGKNLFKDIIENLFEFEKRPYEEAVSGNSQLRRPSTRPNIRERFQRDYVKIGFIKSYKKNTRLLKVKRTIKRIIKKVMGK